MVSTMLDMCVINNSSNPTQFMFGWKKEDRTPSFFPFGSVNIPSSYIISDYGGSKTQVTGHCFTDTVTTLTPS